LAIEFLDELVFGLREAAWPLVRDDLHLSYTQVGLLLGVPGIFGAFVEPIIGILGDTWRRRWLVLCGGLAFALAALLTAWSPVFGALMVASLVFYPASGAFVSLSQADLIDSQPGRHEQMMARWTLAGSVGVVAGPLALGAAVWVGLGWRGAFVVFAAMTAGLVMVLAKTTGVRHPAASQGSFSAGLRGAGQALMRGVVWRWLLLLFFSDLMLDILLGFLALYLVDVGKVSLAAAGIGVVVWSTAGLAGDALLVPLIERVHGLRYLRLSAGLTLVVFPLFLVVPWFAGKLVLLAMLGLLNSGWYAIPKAQLYAAMPGQSGTVMAVDSTTGLLIGLVPVGLGLFASQFGLHAMMWLLLTGPIALLVGLPRHVQVALVGDEG
jgi:FSR family fosmidomycin resistance protein-like MFS transporter